jgi:hypothetical protein
VGRYLGKEPGHPLGWLERIGFFANDFALNLLIVPLVGTVLITAAFGAWRVAVACVGVAVLSLAYFVELRASTEVGQYISGEMLRDLVGWSAGHPASAVHYVSRASVVKLAVLLSALGALLLAARGARDVASHRGRRAWTVLLATPAVGIAGVAVILTPLAYLLRWPGSPLNTSAVALAATALMTPAHAKGASPWLSLDDALGSLRRLTHTAPFDRSHGLVGAEAGSDLVVFVMETGPSQAFERAGARRPSLEKLRPHTLESRRHYTAHPYSSDALFAILSGTYPHGRRVLLQDLGDRQVNGIFSGLPDDVGLRAVYLPSLYQLALDEEMYQTFGARTLYVSDRHPDDALRRRARVRAEATLRDLGGDRLEPAARDRLRRLLVDDLQALERVKADIASAIASGGRYAVMFYPGIGHGPWPPVVDDPDLLARGRAFMDLQDAWLGELMDVIAAGRRLDRTVIAVTADHGLRTRAEYPRLRVGFLGDVMFRVPLLVYAPRAIAAETVLDAPTSHVDLAPTLLALLGASDAASRMHGVPIWQRTPRDRLYLLASAYGGADGFVENGRFYMHQVLSGAVYGSDRFDFTDADQVRPGEPLSRFVIGALDQASEGQHALAIRLRSP